MNNDDVNTIQDSSYKLPLFIRLLLILLITVLHVACSIPFIYRWKESGTLIPSTAASTNIPGWQSITANQIVKFLTSQMLGYIAFTCIVQFLKEKSGTIWIPVLVHTIMDYLGILKLN